jgi:exopolysaccharide biosynthesis polyprenyl glycosylphosphotransferase
LSLHLLVCDSDRGGNRLSFVNANSIPVGAELARSPGLAAEPERARDRGWVIRRGLLLADALGLIGAFVVTSLIFGPGAGSGNRFALATEYALFAATLPGWLLAAKLHELYDRDEERTEHSTVDEFTGVLHVITLGVWGLYVGSWLTGLAEPELSKAALFWVLSVVFVTGARAGARALCRRSAAYIQRTLIVGAGDTGQLVARKLLQHPEYRMELVGFADDDPRPLRRDLGGHRVIGGLQEVPELVRVRGVHRVLIAFSRDDPQSVAVMVARLKALGVQVDIVPRLFDVVGPNVTVHSIEGLPLIGLPSPKLLPFSRTIKRAIDLVGASLLLVLTSPIFAIAALQVHRDSPGPIFFRQLRVGKGMETFSALKFRTMQTGTDESAHRAFIQATMDAKASPTASGLYKLDRSDAVTSSGRWLRKTSLDELPQLINILRGEMSLVGPRPCLEYELENFAPHHFERFNVPAGLTGLWQVTARAHSTFGEALEFDVAYARNWSLGLDLLLLLRTPFQILRQRDATR